VSKTFPLFSAKAICQISQTVTYIRLWCWAVRVCRPRGRSCTWETTGDSRELPLSWYWAGSKVTTLKVKCYMA